MSKAFLAALVMFCLVMASSGWAQCYPPGYLVYNKMKGLETKSCEEPFLWFKTKKNADDPNAVSQAEFTAASTGMNWISGAQPSFKESYKAKSECPPKNDISYMTCKQFIEGWGLVTTTTFTGFAGIWPAFAPALVLAAMAGDIGCSEGGGVCFKLGGNLQNYWWCIGPPPKGQTGITNIYDCANSRFLTKAEADALIKGKK